jgi:hypothetical protein
MVKELEIKVPLSDQCFPKPFFAHNEILYVRKTQNDRYIYDGINLANVTSYSISPHQEVFIVLRSPTSASVSSIMTKNPEDREILVKELDSYFERRYRAQLIEQLLIANPICPVDEIVIRVNEVVKVLKENKLPFLLKY